MVPIGQHQRIRCRAAHHIETVKHLSEGNQVQIRPTQPACGHAGTGQKGSLKTCAGGKLGGQPIPYGGHDNEIRLGEQSAHSLGRGHGVSLFRVNKPKARPNYAGNQGPRLAAPAGTA